MALDPRRRMFRVAEARIARQAGITTTGMVLKQPTKVLLAIKGFSEGEANAPCRDSRPEASESWRGRFCCAAKVEKIRAASKKIDQNAPSSFFISGTVSPGTRIALIRPILIESLLATGDSRAAQAVHQDDHGLQGLRRDPRRRRRDWVHHRGVRRVSSGPPIFGNGSARR
jgi:hypothetical protein